MKLEAYLKSLSDKKRQELLGKDDATPYAAFAGKRVVHAGLMGEPVAKSEMGRVLKEALAEEADATLKHALYIHIPFCQTRCLYCGFYQSATSQAAEDEYLEYLLAEIERDAKSVQLQTARIDCVFFGGGTPTSLSPKNAARLLASVQRNFNLAPDVEVTFEGRVHDLVPEKIEAWLAGGVTRVSLGVQSFNTRLRQMVKRIDPKEEVMRRLKLLKSYDVTVIADLIYGLPGQTPELWMEDLKDLVASPVDGMDVYQLNVWKGGPLYKAVEAGIVPPCADLAGQAKLYQMAQDFLPTQGFERLSICHWRRNKRERSLYNTLVKGGAAVYPFGCGAGGNFAGVSFMGARLVKDYQETVARGEKPVMMMGYQVERHLKDAGDAITADLEMGTLDLGALIKMDARLSELEYVLKLWEDRGLMKEEREGFYRLTRPGEFWYVSLTQSLVECTQVLMSDEPEEKDGAAKESALMELMREMMPGHTEEEYKGMLKKIPYPVRKMLERSSKEKLKNMLAGLPPEMMSRMKKL